MEAFASNNTATARGAFRSVMGTVSAVAGTVTSLVEVGADSVTMLNRYVSVASEKQKLTADYDMATFENSLLNRVALEETKQNREVKEFFNEDSHNKDMFETAYSRIQKAVAKRRGEPVED